MCVCLFLCTCVYMCVCLFECVCIFINICVAHAGISSAGQGAALCLTYLAPSLAKFAPGYVHCVICTKSESRHSMVLWGIIILSLKIISTGMYELLYEICCLNTEKKISDLWPGF